MRTGIIADLHIGGWWEALLKQRRVFDMVSERKLDRLVMAGDSFDPKMAGWKTLWGHPSFVELRIVTSQTPTILLEGNVPHDDWRILRRIHEQLPYATIKKRLRIGDWMVTHGAEFDRRLWWWERFRWLYPHMKRVEWLVRRLPSGMIENASTVTEYAELERRTGDIHRAAQQYAIRQGCNIIMGHTHVREVLEAGGRTMQALGPAGARGHGVMLVIDDETNEIETHLIEEGV